MITLFSYGIPLTYVASFVLTFFMLVLLLGAEKMQNQAAFSTWVGLLAAGLVAALGIQAHNASMWLYIFVGFTLAVGFFVLHHDDVFDKRFQAEASTFLLVLGIGAIVLSSTRNVMEMAVGIELLSLGAAAAFAMCRGSRSLEGSFKYFVLTAMTFAAFLFGAACYYLDTGSLLLNSNHVLNPLGLVGIALMVGGVAFKMALVPSYFGALDAYTTGSAGVVGVVMSLSKVGAAVALARLVSTGGDVAAGLVVALALISMVVGVIGGFAQTDLRRLLAYSAVTHGGFVALAAASAQGEKVASYYVFIYGVAVLAAFSALSRFGSKPILIAQLGQLPLGRLRSFVLIISLASLAGLPPLPGFWAKLSVLQSAWGQFGIVTTMIAALAGVIGVIYYLAPIPALLGQWKVHAPPGPLQRVALIFTSVALIVLIVLPGALWGWI